MQAIRSARPGGSVSYVGVPHAVALDGTDCSIDTCICTVGLHRFAATFPNLFGSCRPEASIPKRYLTWSCRSSRLQRAIAMDERRAIKTLLRT